MKEQIKKYINTLSNPLLYYVHNEEYSVFKNFCLFKNNGNLYDRVIEIKDAGKILEYKIDLDKKLRIYAILLTIIVYMIFIHLLYSLAGLLFCEAIWIVLFFGARIYCSELYKNKLIYAFGQYTITEFNPPLNSAKSKQYLNNYFGKLTLVVLTLTLFTGLSLTLQSLIKFNVNKTKPNYNNAAILSEIYTKIYPKIPVIYEINAQADYIAGDFKGAAENYTKAFEMYDKNFSQKDFIRFANLLYILKKSSGSQEAIDKFNEYATKKDLNIAKQTKLLWIKSMFSIASGIPEFIESDYDDLISAINQKKDNKSKFYALSDKAYMLYLMKDYKSALNIYNDLISYALKNNKDFKNEIPRLFAERGFTRKQLHDIAGGNSDFLESKIDRYEIDKYEPKITEPVFIAQKF